MSLIAVHGPYTWAFSGIGSGAATATNGSIAPTTMVRATGGLLTMTGTNFRSNQTFITIDGVQQPTTYVSATSVTTMIDPNEFAAGARSVGVYNVGEQAAASPKTLTLT